MAKEKELYFGSYDDDIVMTEYNEIYEKISLNWPFDKKNIVYYYEKNMKSIIAVNKQNMYYMVN
jgi:hypothetical protein